MHVETETSSNAAIHFLYHPHEARPTYLFSLVLFCLDIRAIIWSHPHGPWGPTGDSYGNHVGEYGRTGIKYPQIIVVFVGFGSFPNKFLGKVKWNSFWSTYKIEDKINLFKVNKQKSFWPCQIEIDISIYHLK